MIGEHTVTVTVRPPAPPEADGTESVSLQDKSAPKIAERFSNPAGTPFKFTVESGKTNEFELRVTSN